MSTLGYVFILVSALIIRGVTKGRGITELPGDLAAMFTALVTSDQSSLTAVLARTGEGNTPTLAASTPPVASAAGAGATDTKAEKGLTAPTATARRTLTARFPGLTIGGYRTGPDAQDHAKGRALDVMTGKDHAKGAEVAAVAETLPGVHYVMWNHRIWNVDRAAEGWRAVPSRGSSTANHEDHVHVSFK